MLFWGSGSHRNISTALLLHRVLQCCSGMPRPSWLDQRNRSSDPVGPVPFPIWRAVMAAPGVQVVSGRRIVDLRTLVLSVTRFHLELAQAPMEDIPRSLLPLEPVSQSRRSPTPKPQRQRPFHVQDTMTLWVTRKSMPITLIYRNKLRFIQRRSHNTPSHPLLPSPWATSPMQGMPAYPRAVRGRGIQVCPRLTGVMVVSTAKSGAACIDASVVA